MPLRVLVLSRTPIGERMSSPGIRYVNMARVLRGALPEAEVTLAAPREFAQAGASDDRVVAYDPATVLRLAGAYDVVISMSFPLSLVFALPLLRRPLLVLDFFSQFHFEWMEAGRDVYTGLHRRLWTKAVQTYANLQLLLADYVLCANERQRDAYLGALASLGRLEPSSYDRDPTLRALIDVAPHGVRPQPPPRTSRPLDSLHQGLRPGDKLLLWLGGVLYWYDPVTLLRALARVRKRHPEAKLLFLGSVYPGSSVTGQGARLQQAIEEAKRLGLWETGVFLHKEWLPHEQVVEFLAASHAAVTTYFDNAETRFSHRTRFLDYIWAGLPLVCTEGDVLAEEVRTRGWGIAVPERDEEALVAALTRVLEDDEFVRRCRENLRVGAATLSWEAAFGPLVRFLSRPGGPKALDGPRLRRVVPVYRTGTSYLALRAAELTARALRAGRGYRAP